MSRKRHSPLTLSLSKASLRLRLIATLALPAKAFELARGDRMPFRAVINDPPDGNLPVECAGLLATLEIYSERSGRTTALTVAGPRFAIPGGTGSLAGAHGDSAHGLVHVSRGH